MRKLFLVLVSPFLLLSDGAWSGNPPLRQESSAAADVDGRVQRFLESHRSSWHDMNVPMSDGKILHNLIIEHKYTRALEIGTSTGHSGIWIAWALSKTGGRLVTIEIDRDRHEEALSHFREAGLSQYIDARLGDAHQLVPALAGPFDFVFCDADKDWYKNYLAACLPKLTVGGCFAAHNISKNAYGGYSRDFLQYARSLPYLDTAVLDSGGAGISVSFKKSENKP